MIVRRALVNRDDLSKRRRSFSMKNKHTSEKLVKIGARL